MLNCQEQRLTRDLHCTCRHFLPQENTHLTSQEFAVGDSVDGVVTDHGAWIRANTSAADWRSNSPRRIFPLVFSLVPASENNSHTKMIMSNGRWANC